MSGLKIAIFDVDGTLVDSQAHIHAAMTAAFDEAGRSVPERAEVLSVVGLSLPAAIARLAPDMPADRLAAMVATYKDAYAGIARMDGHAASPLFDGVRAVLDALAERDDVLLGVATGKSRRGLDHVLDMHGLRRYFVTTQVADDHPSKPDPAMVLAALSETGCAAADAVMIGDTVYDMEMGQAAGVATLAVTWGYHPEAELRATGPGAVIADVPQMERAVLKLLGLGDE